MDLCCGRQAQFQHTAARRRLAAKSCSSSTIGRFQHTAARRRLDALTANLQCRLQSFNTQPPEGGWVFGAGQVPFVGRFQHTAARRRLAVKHDLLQTAVLFQHTAARRRLDSGFYRIRNGSLFQHTAARRRLDITFL